MTVTKDIINQSSSDNSLIKTLENMIDGESNETKSFLE